MSANVGEVMPIELVDIIDSGNVESVKGHVIS
jgi:hypothetical protein